MAGAVRTPIGRDARLPTRRRLDERLYARWPSAYARISRAVARLPPRSQLRRTLLRQATLSGWGAGTRGDLDLMLVRYAPDYHFEPSRELVPAGLRTAYRGHAGVREWFSEWREAYERIELRPHEIVDAGDVVVVLGHVHLRARGSGIELDFRVGNVYWTERGLVVRERQFADWDEALRAAGFPARVVDRGRVTSPP
jgi:ketosteroid isomerase-like protein